MSLYRMTCEALPRFLPDSSDTQGGVYAFAYTITITNTGRVPAQLIARHWVIEDGLGRVEEVKGLGVVGQQPLLQPGASFQYDSGASLKTPIGTMRGRYFFVAVDGERFEADIPLFVLDSGATTPGRVFH
jgi:ApaG protein